MRAYVDSPPAENIATLYRTQAIGKSGSHPYRGDCCGAMQSIGWRCVANYSANNGFIAV